MPTIIDSLVVMLGLDTGDYDKQRAKVKRSGKELTDDAASQSRKVSDANKSQGKSFEAVASQATKFLAVIGGTVAIKRFVEQTIESNAALNRLSLNLGQGVSDISAWSQATELAGGSAQGLQGTMSMLSKAQTELQLTGQSSLIPYFSALGISMADARGQARPVSDILLDLSEKLSKLDRVKAFNMGQMMGVDEGTLNLLLKGRREVESLIKTQKEFNAVTKKQAEESAKLERMITESKQSFNAFGRELLSSATPALEKLFEIFADFGTWCQENQEFVKTFLTIVAVGLAGLAAAITPINLTVVAVTGLAAALAALYQDYQVWKRGGDSLIDWSKWEPGIKAATTGIEYLKDLMQDLVYRAVAAADMLSAVFNRDWDRLKFAAQEFKTGTGKKYGPGEKENAEAATTVTGAAVPKVAEMGMGFGAKMGQSVREFFGIDTPAPATVVQTPHVAQVPKAAAVAPIPTPKPAANAPRGIRNNNPGNLNFAGQKGATKETGEAGRFAVFGSMEAGISALVKQIDLYINRGNNTIRGILQKYAPSSENDTGAYINAVSKATGVAPDQPLDRDNAAQMQSLIGAIINHENGRGFVSPTQIAGGYQIARGSPKVAEPEKTQIAKAVPAAPRTPAVAPVVNVAAAPVAPIAPTTLTIPTTQQAPSVDLKADISRIVGGIIAGNDTIRKLLPGNTSTEVARETGLNPNQVINRRDDSQIVPLIRAMLEREKGKGYATESQITQVYQTVKGELPQVTPQPVAKEAPAINPVDMYRQRRENAGLTPTQTPTQPVTAKPSEIFAGIPNATRNVQSVGAAQMAAQNVTHGPTDNSTSIETTVGEVKIYTAATDAKGIAEDMQHSLDFLFTSQANYSLT